MVTRTGGCRCGKVNFSWKASRRESAFATARTVGRKAGRHSRISGFGPLSNSPAEARRQNTRAGASVPNAVRDFFLPMTARQR